MDIPKRKSVWDNLMTGLMMGFFIPVLVSPLIAWIIMQYSRYSGGLSGFYDQLFMSPSSSSSMISLSVLCNLPVFFILYKRKWDSTGKGVIMSSIVYAIIVFVLKLT